MEDFKGNCGQGGADLRHGELQGRRRDSGSWSVSEEVLAVAFGVATFVSGCTALGTLCAPGTLAPTTAEVAWSAGPYGSGLVPAMGCETGRQSTAPSPSPVAEAPAAPPKAPVSETAPR